MLRIDQIVQDNFFCSIPDVVHRPYPRHLVAAFEGFGDAFGGGDSGDEALFRFGRFAVDLCEVGVQLAGRLQTGADRPLVRAEILIPEQAVFADPRRFWCFKIWQEIAVTRQYLEVDFICNLGSGRVYIQSAYSIPDEEKRAQETRSFRRIDDSFKKIIVTRDTAQSWYDDNGILTVSIYDFLPDRTVIEK